MEIEVGSVYKIETTHSSLPVSLKSIQAVLVEDKTDEEVKVVFPSTESLKRFFTNEKKTGLMQPTFDEKFVMSLKVGQKILTQKVSFEEFAAQRGNQTFWATIDFDDDDDKTSNIVGLEIKWGKRRKATFCGKNRGDLGKTILPCISDKKKSDDHDDDDKKVVPMDEGKEDKTEKKVRVLKKRKCQFKGVKYVEKKRRKQAKGNTGKKFINSHHRWTVDRYKVAEKNMLEIMKEKGAVPGNPILRPDLRTEARKVIGDTGLLDHLLKHMAGKLAPGGKERFRRRHNPEGAMEYWLEDADLVEVRKKEGIDDPFWVPPPGWKPGDCPNQDPVCAKGIMELREEVANMKREMGKLLYMRQKENNEALMSAPEETEDVGRLNFLGSLKPLKAMYTELLKKKDHVEKQLSDVSKSLFGMEDEIGMLKRSAASNSPKAKYQEVADKETKGLAEPEGEEEQDKGKRIGAAINEPETSQNKQAEEIQKAAPKPEDKAEENREKSVLLHERRQRLKSGFRICKPQGTFLWPSQMPSSCSSSSSSSSSSQVVVHLEDLFGYPTPPSVSSSSCRAPPLIFPPPPPQPHHHHHHHHQQPPFSVKKPVAKKAAVTLTFSTSTIRGSTTIESIASPTETTGSSSVVHSFVPDLNEVPFSPFAC